jgi:hypothetical protein
LIKLTAAFSGLALILLASADCPSNARMLMAQGELPQVDVLLALGVDISYSMDEEEQHLQRGGYIEALTSKPVLDAISGGVHGRIAMTYYEWAGTFERRAIMPWTLIDSPESAKAFAEKLRALPYRRASRTSVSGGLDFGVAQLDSAPFRSLHRVIDLSGDGPNNEGRPVENARNEAIAKSIVINGLPIIFQRRFNPAFDIENLDEFYFDCVIGGQGSFMIPVADNDQFAEATRRKLLREIAGDDSTPSIRKAADRPKTDCLIGEKMWERRFGRD